MGRGQAQETILDLADAPADSIYLAVLAGDSLRRVISAPTDQQLLVEFAAHGDGEALDMSFAIGQLEELWRVVAPGCYTTVWKNV